MSTIILYALASVQNFVTKQQYMNICIKMSLYKESTSSSISAIVKIPFIFMHYLLYLHGLMKMFSQHFACTAAKETRVSLSL